MEGYVGGEPAGDMSWGGVAATYGNGVPTATPPPEIILMREDGRGSRVMPVEAEFPRLLLLGWVIDGGKRWGGGRSRVMSGEVGFPRLHLPKEPADMRWDGFLTVATTGDPRSTKGAGIHPHQPEKPPANYSRAHIRRYSPPPRYLQNPWSGLRLKDKTRGAICGQPGKNKRCGVDARRPVEKVHGFVTTWVSTTASSSLFKAV